MPVASSAAAAPSRSDVVIVGAGPAGASLGLLLAERGLRVTLVEATRRFDRQFRGQGLMPCGLEALAEMGLEPLLAGLPQRALAGWSFWINGRELFDAAEPLGSTRPCTLVPQPALLEALVQRACRNESFSWRPGETVQGLVRRQGRVDGVRLSGDRVLAADLVIACDGRSSGLRRAAGLPIVSAPSPIDVLWFRLPAQPRCSADNRFMVLLGPGGGCSVFPAAEGGELQLGWLVGPGERITRTSLEWAEAFASLAPDWLAAHVRGHAAAIRGPEALSVQVGCCPRWQEPGLLLLGDAAHPMSPVRAQGINMALRDAIVAANWLVPPLQQGAGTQAIDAVLPRIQQERQAEIQLAQRAQQAEAAQGDLLRRRPDLRFLLAPLAPLAGPLVKALWVRRQAPLRDGFLPVRLRV
ncbi:FAD-dependent monooxygenase [Synechococcus sp. Lug-A]|uniref:FAD-dependent oxidoreductase n=1 Tax=Synechococcus sp. Lug-A TaxID=2823740 RepID=UPI0020CEA4C6|nr:FAD-dependent oxidoreductase [Synechococcus sp. Lug-A]MCP9846729.1 FAD-dependent monooxygenase [Synechococcus sp. Lug-A]